MATRLMCAKVPRGHIARAPNKRLDLSASRALFANVQEGTDKLRLLRFITAARRREMEIQTTLDIDDLRSRLKLDYQVVMLMRSPLIIIEAYRNVDDLRARRDPVVSEAEGHLATHYRVDYNIKTLIGQGRYSNKTTVHFDLFANIDYPFEEPGCFVIDSPMPWSPHFYIGHTICLGPLWEQAEGNLLLGQLLVHVAKLLNFDEPEYAEANYGGYNPDAVEYWEKVLERQPITKNLRYPPLPDLVTAPPPPDEPTVKAFIKKKIIGTPTPAIRIRPAHQAQAEASRIRIRKPGANVE